MDQVWAFIITYTLPFSVAVCIMSAAVWGVVVIYESQRDAELYQDTRLVLHIAVKGGSPRKYPITGQNEAQEILNGYMFHRILSAIVRDPVTGEIVARMDSNGRLIAA